MISEVLGSIKIKKTPWLKSAREIYWPSDRNMSAKLVPTLRIEDPDDGEFILST
jgi:hypothetical protein